MEILITRKKAILNYVRFLVIRKVLFLFSGHILEEEKEIIENNIEAPIDWTTQQGETRIDHSRLLVKSSLGYSIG
jgi:hypothetical protein